MAKLTRSQLNSTARRPIDHEHGYGPMPSSVKRAAFEPDISDVICDCRIERQGRLLIYRRVSDGQLLGWQHE